MSVVIHGPGASFFVGTELIAAGGRARADGARGSAGAHGDRGAPGGSRRGVESAQVDGADSGEDNHSNGYDDSEYDSSEMEQEEEGARRRRGRRRIEVLMDRCRGGVDAVVRWGRSRRQHLRGTRGLARGGAGTSAARGGGTSDSGDADTESEYDERNSEDRERGWAPYDECDENEGYCMECRRSADGEQGAEAGNRQHGCAHGSVGGNGDGAEQEEGGESDSSAVSCSSGYSRSSGGESKASADNDGDGAEAALLDFQFAPLREASGQAEGDMWVEAVHVVLPPPPASARGGWEGVDVAGMEAIFDPRCVKWFQRVKRLFIALLLLGSIFYIVSFIAGVMANRGKSVEVVPVDTGAAGQGQAAAGGGTGGLDTNFDYVSHAMLTSSNIWVAMAYLVLYLSLDMIGFAGAILENVSLLTLYIVVELIITFISALEALRPFLLFRLLVILLALRLRYCALKVEDAERRLFSRLMGRPMPPPNRRTWLAHRPASATSSRASSHTHGRSHPSPTSPLLPPPPLSPFHQRLGIFPGTLSAMFRHAPLSRFQLRGRPWYAELVRLHALRLQHLQQQQQLAQAQAQAQAQQRQLQRERRRRQEMRSQRRHQRQQRQEWQEQAAEQRQQDGQVDVRGGGVEERVERGGAVEAQEGRQQQQVAVVMESSVAGQQVAGEQTDRGAPVVPHPHSHHHHHPHHHHHHHCHEHEMQQQQHAHGEQQHHHHHCHHHHIQQHPNLLSSQANVEQQRQGVGEAARVDDVGVEVRGQEQEQVAQQQQQQQQQQLQLQQEEDVKEGALEAIGGSTSDPGSADSSRTPCPHAAAVAACNAPVPLLPTAGLRTGTAGVVAVEADETPLGSPGASDHFSIDITDTPLTPHTQVEPEQAAEAAEEERESDAALAAQLLLPPPFPLVPHLPVPRTPSSSLPPSRSVSLTHQQQSTDADLPASPSAAMLPPATSVTLMSSPLPSLPSTSA
ncbi:unnamed protein product [Closterium sp. Naga37s-1]|nr:unnamed protein product [Closterium sp. Naga37s-1]